MPITFPYETLKARSVRFDIAGSSIGGGLSNNGQQQVVNASGGGLWILSLSGFIIRTPAQVRAWRRIQYGSQAGVVPVNVPVCELRNAPISGVPHSDGSPFSDGSLYRWLDVAASTVGNMALRATSGVFSFEGGAEPEGGELFSIEYAAGYHSLHAITSVTPSGDNFAVTFVPPTRAAVVSGSALEFKHPTCTMRLASPDAMALTVDLARFAGPSATFVEYFA